MARSNDDVAAMLQEYADLISITGGEAFKARVYEKAARAVGGYDQDVASLSAEEMRQISGVGQSLADKIITYLETGELPALEKLRAKIPAGVRALTAIPTLGPKKAVVLYDELGISSVDELADAIDSEKLRGLKGFGPKTEDNIKHGIQLLRQSKGRVHLDTALDIAEEIVAELSQVSGCLQCTYAGSLRRMRETIGDIDVLAAAEDTVGLRQAFSHLSTVEETIAAGGTKSSIRTKNGLQIDLRVVAPEAWGAALQYFTGSKAHNIRTREMAIRKGLKLSEYGLFTVDGNELVVSESEEEVYHQLGLPWIPPTLREDRGEIEAALRGELPDLVTERDIRGDLHTHTKLTDGVSTLDEMVAAAADRHYRYFAITDHAPNLWMQRMTDEKMLKQRKEVRQLQKRYPKLRLLHGTELNIDEYGDVDWPPEFLQDFDICVASVHSHFTQSTDDMTRRLIRACENPYVNVIGHPTARSIGRRDPINADLDAVFAACARTGTALEVNSLPDRLDLSDEHIKRAKKYGVKFAIDSDAHSAINLGFLRYGVATAQRGWLTADDVINTWPPQRLTKFLHKPGQNR